MASRSHPLLVVHEQIHKGICPDTFVTVICHYKMLDPQGSSDRLTPWNALEAGDLSRVPGPATRPKVGRAQYLPIPPSPVPPRPGSINIHTGAESRERDDPTGTSVKCKRDGQARVG